METVCFTGRRPKDLCGYKWSNYEKFQDKFVEFLETLYSQGVRKFITGGAQGFDQMSFWAVHRLKQRHPDIKNILYIPFRNQADAWKGRACDAFSKEEYNKMLSLADEILYVTDALLKQFPSIVKALYARNHKMVIDAEAVIALYPSDDWNVVKGGTAECMRYAKSVNKAIHQIKYHISNENELIFDSVFVLN